MGWRIQKTKISNFGFGGGGVNLEKKIKNYFFFVICGGIIQKICPKRFFFFFFSFWFYVKELHNQKVKRLLKHFTGRGVGSCIIPEHVC